MLNSVTCSNRLRRSAELLCCALGTFLNFFRLGEPDIVHRWLELALSVLNWTCYLNSYTFKTTCILKLSNKTITRLKMHFNPSPFTSTCWREIAIRWKATHSPSSLSQISDKRRGIDSSRLPRPGIKLLQLRMDCTTRDSHNPQRAP